MHSLLTRMAMALAAIATISVLSISAAAQVSPTTPRAPRVRIIQGPELELSKEFLTIIRWTTNNPGGAPEHYGVVHYGTDPKNLNQTSKSPIRLNPGHASTVFRVRLPGLKPATNYYYTVGSMAANGAEDRMESGVHHFKTPPAALQGRQ